MAEDGESYSPDEKRVITINDRRYSVRGFIPANATIRYLDDGLPFVGGKRLYDKETGELDIVLQNEAKSGSTLVGRLIDEETKKLANPPAKNNILLKKIKRIF